MSKFHNTQTGKYGELQAQEYISKLGHQILYKNMRTPFGELDIISNYKNSLHIIEVKTRKTDIFGQGWEAVNTKKLEHIKKSTEWFMKEKSLHLAYQIDVISITLKPFIQIEYFENITL